MSGSWPASETGRRSLSHTKRLLASCLRVLLRTQLWRQLHNSCQQLRLRTTKFGDEVVFRQERLLSGDAILIPFGVKQLQRQLCEPASGIIEAGKVLLVASCSLLVSRPVAIVAVVLACARNANGRQGAAESSSNVVWRAVARHACHHFVGCLHDVPQRATEVEFAMNRDLCKVRLFP